MEQIEKYLGKISEVSVNWFDFLLVGVLILGIVRGRKRGMSMELLDVLKWLLIIYVGSISYKPLGNLLSLELGISRLSAYLTVYCGTAIFIHVSFGLLKTTFGSKLVGSDVFGSAEYYLGMMAGALRWSCILLFWLSLLNAKYISPEKKKAMARVQQENFGDISFPTIGSLQDDVFLRSLTGPLIQTYFQNELVSAGPATGPKREGIGKQRERLIDEVMGEKPATAQKSP